MGSRPGAALLALTLTALVLAAARQAAFGLAPTVRVEPAEVPITSSGQALVGYDEHLLVAPFAGRVQRLVEEGRRVARGTPVVRLTANAGAGTWMTEHEDLDAQLAHLQRESLPQARRRAEAAAAALAGELDRLRARQEAPGLTAAHATWREARGRLADLEQEARRLEARLAELRRLLPSGAPELRAPISGTVSFAIDGLSGELTGERFVETAPALLMGESSARLETMARPAPAGSSMEVAAGHPLARILDSWTARIALPVPAEAVRRGWVEAGDVLEWTIEGQAVRARVTALVPTGDGRAVAVGQVESGLPVLMPRHTAPYRLTWGSVSGVAVPASALLKTGGGAWVAAVEPTALRWLRVQRVWPDAEPPG
ncbi:MAG TPA: hypothetical protein VF282_04925, partial [Bacillota bacterium]